MAKVQSRQKSERIVTQKTVDVDEVRVTELSGRINHGVGRPNSIDIAWETGYRNKDKDFIPVHFGSFRATGEQANTILATRTKKNENVWDATERAVIDMLEAENEI